MSGNNSLSWFSLYVVCILVKHNIEASLDDRDGLFFVTLPRLLSFFFITSPFEGLKKLQTSSVFHLPSPLLISDKSLNPIKTASIVQEGSSDFPFCNLKTAHDKAIKITKYKCTHHFHHLGKTWFTQWRKLTFIMTFYCWTWEVTERFSWTSSTSPTQRCKHCRQLRRLNPI